MCLTCCLLGKLELSADDDIDLLCPFTDDDSLYLSDSVKKSCFVNCISHVLKRAFVTRCLHKVLSLKRASLNVSKFYIMFQKCICPNCKVYWTICPHCTKYFLLLNIFVQTAKYICLNCKLAN